MDTYTLKGSENLVGTRINCVVYLPFVCVPELDKYSTTDLYFLFKSIYWLYFLLFVALILCLRFLNTGLKHQGLSATVKYRSQTPGPGCHCEESLKAIPITLYLPFLFEIPRPACNSVSRRLALAFWPSHLCFLSLGLQTDSVPLGPLSLHRP